MSDENKGLALHSSYQSGGVKRKDSSLTHYSSLITHDSSLRKSFPIKIDQLNRRSGCFEAFVAQFLASAIDCLIDIVRRNDAKQQWHAGLQGRFADPAHGLGGDVIEMWCLASDDHTETNHRIEFSGLCRFQSTERNLKRTRHAKNLKRVFVCR